MPRYLAIKEGWDGRRIVKKGEIFNFSGARGSWMVPCDGAGKPLKEEDIPPKQRLLRAGSKIISGQGRDALRTKCRDMGIPFKATLSGVELAELIRGHEEGVQKKEDAALKSSENPDGGAPGVGEEGKGTGNLEVL